MNWKECRDQSLTALNQAICLAGGEAQLTRIIGRSHQQINAWKLPVENKRARPIPMDVCMKIQMAYAVPAIELRPDATEYWSLVGNISQVAA